MTPTYDLGGADRLLLADLASIEQTTEYRDDAVSELSAGLRRSGRAVPVFAMLLAGSTEEIGALAGLRPMCDPAVAFVGASADPTVAETLTDAGWICVPFSSAEGTVSAWQQALGRHRTAVQHG